MGCTHRRAGQGAGFAALGDDLMEQNLIGRDVLVGWVPASGGVCPEHTGPGFYGNGGSYIIPITGGIRVRQQTMQWAL